MGQSGDRFEIETRQHWIREHAGDEDDCKRGNENREGKPRAPDSSPATAARIMKNGGFGRTHGGLDVELILSGYVIIKKPSTIKIVDGLGELLGLA